MPTVIRPALLAAFVLFAAATARAADVARPTVVELFQSQGCSSCPPAIGNVNALAGRPDVLALTFAVTYWDQLGWKDSFATPAYTQRQWNYARGLKHAQVWTPQVVVDGRANVTGIGHGEIEALLAATAARSGPSLSVAGGKVAVGGGGAPAGGADIWLVRYDPRTIEVAIRAGENQGRTLGHRNVVRQLLRLGRWTGQAATLAIPRAVAGLSTAVLVQASGGPILAAARG